MLQKLLITASEEMIEHITRTTNVECVPYDNTASSSGSVIVVLRPQTDEQVTERLDILRDASTLGVPVLVVAGVRDTIGEKFLYEASLCGIPRECILLVENGQVIDANGMTLGNALRGRSIGVSPVLSAAERAVKEELIPEIALWEDNKKEETALWESKLNDQDNNTTEKVELSNQNSNTTEKIGLDNQDSDVIEKNSITTDTEEPLRKQRCHTNDDSSGWTRQDSPLYAFFDATESLVAIFSAKSGVGATTVAACLSGALADYNSLHLEIASSSSGYVYYGDSLSQALSSGQYAFFDGNKLNGDVRQTDILVADVSTPEAADIIYDQARCVVVVTDGSPIAFRKVQNWIKNGYRLDILVVNRVTPGAGYPPEVYAGEFNLEHVVGIPGGPNEEATLNQAQHNGTLPLGESVNLDTAVNELATIVLKVIKIKAGEVAV